MLTPTAPFWMPVTVVTPKSAVNPGWLSTRLMPLPPGVVTVVAWLCTVPLDCTMLRPGPALLVELAEATTTARSAVLAAIEAPPVAVMFPPVVVAPAFWTTSPVPLAVVTCTWPSEAFVASTLLFCSTMPLAVPGPTVVTFVLVDENGTVLKGRHRVEPTAMFIHAAAHRITGHAVVLLTHMPYATALTLTTDRALDTCSSQGAMRFHGRIGIDASYNGLALDWLEGERIARSLQGKDVAFLGNHGIIVCGATVAHAYDDLYYLERACMHQVLAMSTGRPLARVNEKLSADVARQIQGEREQSDMYFEALRRMLPAPR